MKKYLHILGWLNRIVLLVFLIIRVDFMQGQDIHFSQFNNAPMNLNPALTGYFGGAIRGIANYRNQWNSVSVPYETFALALDTRGLIKRKPLSFGGVMFYDKTGDSQLSTFTSNLSIAYSIPFDKKNTQGITIGLTGGVTNRSIDYSKLRFDSQYLEGSYDPNNPSNEIFGIDNILFPNIHTGILWYKSISPRTNFHAGLAVFNLNTPNQSYFDFNPISLDRRFNIHSMAQIKISKRVDILPSFQISNQGVYQKINLGAVAKYILIPEISYYRAIYIGAYTRQADAIWVSAAMDIQNFHVCLSYDFNISRLTPASNYRGGFEISVIYVVRNLLPKHKRYLSCPDFM